MYWKSKGDIFSWKICRDNNVKETAMEYISKGLARIGNAKAIVGFAQFFLSFAYVIPFLLFPSFIAWKVTLVKILSTSNK